MVGAGKNIRMSMVYAGKYKDERGVHGQAHLMFPSAMGTINNLDLQICVI